MHPSSPLGWRWLIVLGVALPLLLFVANADQKIVVLDDPQPEDEDEPFDVVISGDDHEIDVTIRDGEGEVIRSYTYPGDIDEFDPDDIRDLEELEALGDLEIRLPSRRHPRDHSDADDIVAFGHDVHVAAGRVVPGDVVVILGSASIDGEVRGEVVSIGGRVEVGRTGQVRGGAVAIGGDNITLEEGAVVRGEVVTVGGRIRQGEHAVVGERIEISFIPSMGRGVGISGIGWLGFLAHLIFVGLAGWIMLRLGLRRTGVSVGTLRSRGWESLLAGVGGGIVYTIVVVPLLLVLGVVLVAIVVGIPLVPVLVLALLLFPVPGYMITGTLLGLSLTGRSGMSVEGDPADPVDPRAGVTYPIRGLGRAFFLGHLLLSVPGLIGLLSAMAGGPGIVGHTFMLLSFVVIVLAIAVGWGAFLLARFGRRVPEMAV